MPSQLHEVLLQLFRNRPLLAPELMRDALHCELPAFTEARIDSADLTDVEPAEYRADLVVLLLDGVAVYGIIVEAQLARKPRKKFVWPVYATSLRARLEVPVCVLVVAADDAIARWAAQPIDLGNGNVFRPLVLSSRSSFSTTSGGGCILTLCSSRSAKRLKGSYEPWIQPSTNIRAISQSNTSASVERRASCTVAPRSCSAC